MVEERSAVHKNAKVLLAKPGLDGHDRGAKVIAIALKEAGMEVVYMGLHQTLEAIVAAAIQEDVDVIGLSILSGGHIPICRRLMGLLAEEGADDIAVCVGGVIPKRDIPVLKEMGVRGVFPGGADLREIADAIKAMVG
jgi:methylmalonyl-CoA mutase C-terminal domain/subunit